MHSQDRFSSLRRSTETELDRGQKLILRGDYIGAEKIFKTALENWRAASAPRNEEAKTVLALGKCLEAQRRYEDAYELYMQSLNNLTGTAYDDVYSSFLYLNERMGTFTKRSTGDFS